MLEILGDASESKGWAGSGTRKGGVAVVGGGELLPILSRGTGEKVFQDFIRLFYQLAAP